jgi:glycosyltransferase involved in cell wall biosynthesis
MVHRTKGEAAPANSRPRVSIGLPVYNGARYLAATLDAILGQTYRDFELIVSDNASTDGTEAIARAAADRDARVRYLRSDHNRGAMWNFHRVFHVSTGEYFKWSADDDLIEPAFLARCVDTLDRQRDAVLCFTRFIEVDEAGAFLRRQRYPLSFCAARPHERLRLFLERARHSQTMFGLIRRDVIRRTRLFADYYGSDRQFLMELSLYGCFAEVEEYLFTHREHALRSAYVESPDVWWAPRAAGRRTLTHWRSVANVIRILRSAPLSQAERARCYAVLGRRAGRRAGRWAPLMLRQLVARPEAS